MFKNNLDKIIARYQKSGFVVVPIRASKDKSINGFLKSLNKETYKDEYAQILAAGGDGSINICVNAMIENDIDLPLAIFPAGTANDFAYAFNIPNDIDQMLDIALGGCYTYADIGKVNNRYFINVAAMGQVVDVSQKTDPTLKNTIGVLAYYLKGLSEVPNLKPMKVKLTTEDNVYEENMYFMVVMNGKSAGGFKNISPYSEINDGLFDVLLFRSMNFVELPQLFIQILHGRHHNNKNVLYFKTNKIKVEAEEPIPTDIDGEHGETFPLEFSMLHRKLKIATMEDNINEEIFVKQVGDYAIYETEQYQRLVTFFVENQLEFDGDEEVDTDIVKSYKLVDGEDNLLGGAVLAMREGRYIIDGIAVEEGLRSKKLGEALLQVVENQVKILNGNEIYLVARAPGFFRKEGFDAIERENAPNFFECKQCPQYMKACFPEEKKKNIE